MSPAQDKKRPGRSRRAASKNLQVACVRVLQRMLTEHGTLTTLLPEAMAQVAEKDQAKLQALSYGMCRWATQLQALVDALLDKPMRDKDLDVYLLLQLGVYQLRFTRMQPHAAVDETVKAARLMDKNWARGLVNAVLRRYQREVDDLEQNLTIAQQLSFPDWLLTRLRADWPDQWESACAESNVQGPMTLRVNRSRVSKSAYASQLQAVAMDSQTIAEAPDALVLETPVSVSRLPGFSEGLVSVQDGAAQLALEFMKRHSAGPRLRLLDACAAPGGKTAHAAESGHFASILALDNNASRTERMTESIERLGLENSVTVEVADARKLDQWWDGETFDVVLLDAPCSGTGVIRRHPDIKLLRKATDMPALVALQRELLDSLWKTVTPGGMLLYVTCSVLHEENLQQTEAFVARTPDAEPLETPLQLFPGGHTMDGFFYAPFCRQS